MLLADLRQENADAAVKTLIDAGFNVTTAIVDVASRASVHALVDKAVSLGEVFGLIHAAGVSPSQATPETILKVDLYGTALVLEKFGNVIARGGSGVVIASQSGHRERLPSRLPAFKARKLVAGHGSGRPLGARVNTISPGIIITPLAKRRTDRTAWRRLPAHD